MTYKIDESLTDMTFTPNGSVASVFGVARRIESITIHHWGSLGQRHDDILDFFVNRNDATSAHFVVSDNRINCLVSPTNASWAAGNAYGNATSIHIECHPEATTGDYNTVAFLVKFLRDTYGHALPIRPHNSWTATACPGKWDLKRLDALARGLETTVKPASAKPAAAKPVAAKPVTKPSGPVAPTGLSWKVEKGDSLDKIAKHYGITVTQLAGYNKIDAKASLKIGLTLHIPGPLVWTVDSGDTLAEIAKHYGLDVKVVAANNGIKDINKLTVGQTISILK